MRADVRATACVSVLVYASVRVCSDRRYLEQSSQETFQQSCSHVGPYLAVAEHDDPHQHHVDLCSQRLVVVDLVHLESHTETEWTVRRTLSLHVWTGSNIHFKCCLTNGPICVLLQVINCIFVTIHQVCEINDKQGTITWMQVFFFCFPLSGVHLSSEESVGSQPWAGLALDHGSKQE